MKKIAKPKSEEYPPYASMYIDLLQIGMVNGEWKIINVLWVPNPDRPRG